MNKQQTNQMSSIRKKLLAAVAMLLVACIMTVSSTYAWFTLSTAPEVKGITTTVGANGNLEIALGTYDTIYGDGNPTSSVGDSMDLATQTVKDANVTWGNLIDLTDAVGDQNPYGLGSIVLYPSRLNASGTKVQYLSPLQYPSYGSDGRIMELKTGTMLGAYSTSASGFMGKIKPSDYAGVNAVGSASSMSERQFAYYNNLAAIASNRVSAENAAKGAINNYGGGLAKLALDNENADAAKVISAADVTLLSSLIAQLEKANGYVGDAIRATILTYVASSQNTTATTDEAWKTMNNAFAGKTMAEIDDTVKAQFGGDWPEGLKDYYLEYTALANTLSTAKQNLTGGTADDGSSTWEKVEAVVDVLLNPSNITICGKTSSEILSAKTAHDNSPTTDPTPDEQDAYEYALAQVMDGKLVFGFSANSGVFSDIAKMTGDYTAYITFPEGLTYSGIPMGGMTKPVDVSKTTTPVTGASAVAATAISHAQGMLGYSYTLLDNKAPAGAGNDSVQALTDTYGYTIDFLFRTNATDSYLQLQQSATDRIYSDNTDASADTMGGGSYMSFTVGEEYTVDRIKQLMGAIRVVFYTNPGDTTVTDANILGVATLDAANGVADAGEYKATLKLMNYTIDEKGIISFNGAAADSKLVALTANEATAVTALVYLDGDIVDNTMVGVATEMAGKLNLQFSSSATLTPMDYNDLHTGSDN